MGVSLCFLIEERCENLRIPDIERIDDVHDYLNERKEALRLVVRQLISIVNDAVS